MLSKSDKEKIIKDIRNDINKAQAVFVTNMVGIGANDAVRIRKLTRDAGGTIRVARNTLFEKAAIGTNCESLFKDLKHANAVAFAFDDPPAVAKVLHDAGKDLELVTLKSGLLNGKALKSADIEALAKLPSRDQMLATVLATMMAPISSFVRVIDAIRQKREAGGSTPS